MPSCLHCHQPFEITPDDLAILKKLSPTIGGRTFDLPLPTHCPQCRQQRRLAFRNEHHLHKRTCDFSGKQIISVFHDRVRFPVYESVAWHSDKWDPRSYGREMDFSRPFFEQFAELQTVVPRMSLTVAQVEDCPYVNLIWFCKNCYMCVDQGWCEDAYYSYATYHSRSVSDCAFARNCELGYELVDCTKCYQSHHLIDCTDCTDASFCVDCQQCSNVAFSKNLRGKQYCLFDKQVTKQQWEEFMNDMKSGSEAQYETHRKEWQQLMQQTLRRATHNLQCDQCVGDYLRQSKDCHMCFDCDESRDLRYCTRIDEKVSTAMDIDHGSTAEVAYEGTSIGGNSIFFTIASYSPTNNNLLYCDTPMNSSNCFGCVSAKNMRYCILNKQYTKDEYEKLAAKVIEHMRTSGEYGEFFPASCRPFAYNESLAQVYFPLTKDEAREQGWEWRDETVESLSVSRKIAAAELPDSIDEIPDDILNWAIECDVTKKPFRVIRQELEFYRKMRLPVPRLHPDERHRRRMALRNPRRLWNRQCAKCKEPIVTSYAPERPEKVYCERCYLSAVY